MFETGVRGAAIGLLLVMAALLLREGRQAVAARLGALFALGSAATVVSAAPAFDGEPYGWLVPLQVLSLGNPVVFWLLSKILFDDDFEPAWPHALAWLAMVAIGLWSLRGGGQTGFLAYKAGAFISLCAAMAGLLRGRAGDLIEARRALRFKFVAAVGLFSGAIVISAVFLHGGRSTPAFGYVDAIGNLLIAGYFAMTLLTVRASAGFEPIASPSPAPPTHAPPADPRELALITTLNRFMDHDRAYRDDGLGIAVLAARLGTPEYRLRQMINQRLGHRNFAAFLNGYRLADAIAALADPSQADVPISTIGLDAGFSSIGVFNRVFKAKTGVTPTDFRRNPAARGID